VIEDEPGEEQRRDYHQEADVADPDVLLFEVGDALFAGLEALLVLFGRGRMHRAIIA
jgi:hypothetical protein